MTLTPSTMRVQLTLTAPLYTTATTDSPSGSLVHRIPQITLLSVSTTCPSTIRRTAVAPFSTTILLWFQMTSQTFTGYRRQGTGLHGYYAY